MKNHGKSSFCVFTWPMATYNARPDNGLGLIKLIIEEIETIGSFQITDWSVLNCDTGKSLSEALIFASTNPQYDNRLFIESRVQYMKIPSSELCTQIVFCFDIQNNLCTQHVLSL